MSFTRSVLGWELVSVAEFLDVIYLVLPSQEGADSICWKLSSQKVFSVNLFYKRLIAPVDKCYPWKSVEISCSLKGQFLYMDSILGEGVND